MDHQFKRLLDLVRRTGDRLVVTDPNGEDTYVLMGLEAYENLADLKPKFEPEPWDKPGRFDDNFMDDYYDEDEDEEDESEDNKFEYDPDWKIPDEFKIDSKDSSPKVSSEPGESRDSAPSAPPIKIWDTLPPAGDQSETWNPEKFNDEEKNIVAEKFENPDFASQPSKKDDDETPGEEQFYLEPIE